MRPPVIRSLVITARAPQTDLILKSHDNPIPGSSKARKVNVEQRLRKLEVDFSPVLQNFVGHFVIEDSGIKGVDVK